MRLKKNRQKNNAFLVEGEKIVAELLQDRKIKIELVCATPIWIETHPHAQLLLKEMLIPVTAAELKQVSNLSTPNQVLAVAQIPTWKILADTVRQDLSIYLDGIQDPGNMGTILRIADWFGIQHVFCSAQSADLYNPKVIQASMGAFLRVQYHRIEFLELQTQFPDTPTFGASLDGDNLFSMKLPKNGILIIGNESKGISEAVLAAVHHKIRIPAAAQQGAESLNAGVATGIICAFFRK